MNLCLLLGCPSACLQTMVDHGIGVNGWDYNGITPLVCAILGNRVECVQFLLDKGADPYDIHIVQRMSFHDDGDVRLYDELGRPMQLDWDSEDKWEWFYQRNVGPTALMYAAAMGNIPILTLMLKAAPKDNIGCPTRFEQYEFVRPLHFAVDYATVEAVSLILDHEDPDEKQDFEPLHRTICRGDTEMFDFLLARMSARVNNSSSDWPIYRCVVQRKPEYLKKIFDSLLHKNVFEIYDG